VSSLLLALAVFRAHRCLCFCFMLRLENQGHLPKATQSYILFSCESACFLWRVNVVCRMEAHICVALALLHSVQTNHSTHPECNPALPCGCARFYGVLHCGPLKLERTAFHKGRSICSSVKLIRYHFSWEVHCGSDSQLAESQWLRSWTPAHRTAVFFFLRVSHLRVRFASMNRGGICAAVVCRRIA